MLNEYLNRNFGTDIIVVFDGYSTNSIKTSERNRRALKHQSTEIFFTQDMTLTTAKDKFLSNISNKERFILELKKKNRRKQYYCPQS